MNNLKILYVYILFDFFIVMFRILVRRFCNMDNAIVDTRYGKLRGIIKENFKGEKFYGYLGIPYAKPPVGDLRFKVSSLIIYLM